MTDVHLFGDVRRGVVNDDGLRLDASHAQARIGQRGIGLRS